MTPKPSSGSDPAERRAAQGLPQHPPVPEGFPQAAPPPAGGVDTLANARAPDEGLDEWTKGFAEPAGGRLGTSMRPETGAALEREILLAGSPRETGGGKPPGMPRAARWMLVVTVLAAAAASGVFFFIQTRKTWEGKVASLENRLTRLRTESSEREAALRRENSAQEREITRRKAEGERIAQLAEETLGQLRASLEDFRKLRDEKLKLEEEYHAVLRERAASFSYFLGRWIPKWAQEGFQRQAPRREGPKASPQADAAAAGRTLGDIPSPAAPLGKPRAD